MTPDAIKAVAEVIRQRGRYDNAEDCARAALAAAQAGGDGRLTPEKLRAKLASYPPRDNSPLTPAGERVWVEGFAAGIEAAAQEVLKPLPIVPAPIGVAVYRGVVCCARNTLAAAIRALADEPPVWP